MPNSGGAETFAKNIGGKILKSIMGITESFNLSSFGNNSKSLGGKIFIPKNDNVKIKSPVSGTAVDIISNIMWLYINIYCTYIAICLDIVLDLRL